MSQAYRLLRSARRKTLAIQVREGEVIVRAPQRARRADIESFVHSRRDWILHHQACQQQAIQAIGVRIEQSGVIPWQGQLLPLFWQRDGTSQVLLQPARVDVHLSRRVRRPEPEAVADVLKRWFRDQARVRLLPRAEILAASTGLKPAQVEIGHWTGRWGQCSNRGEVKLNWRLLQLSPELQDYVILHELCHLKYMHHGPAFQRLLQRHCSDHPRLKREMAQYTLWLNW
ncbi:M48 family metallopeptidase [Marinobacterium weihaiense]|uniref:M48 family metallopeptidase n=1 Tax=Marinobacterium weihaiense TaxID=2851016 RepID=A0ABS6M902_9GAMM|nr:SprT family zinc-dependent metalloprotease [Marinobacterium weihaiense]MBV0932252.1 M48 family metallopeptidase [Marinobacterium weihaiense]